MAQIKPMGKRLERDFYNRDIFIVAEEIIGKCIVRKHEDLSVSRYRITEIEMYIGEDDLACHASKGRTHRTEIMYHEGGKLYVYLIYGMHWLVNIVTGSHNHPQAILIRGINKINGPGRVGKELEIDKSFYGEDLSLSDRIWVEDDEFRCEYEASKRININYAGEVWKNKKYRYIMKL